MKVYLIPGLGADRRMYSAQLEVLPGAEVLEHLPARKGETLSAYSRRLIPYIDTTTPFAIIGTSLGGIISIELLRNLKPEKVILISSVKGRNELPLFIRSMKYLRLHRLISGNGYKRFNKLMAKRLGSRGDRQVADLISQMIMDTPSEFLEWAIDAVVQWNPPDSDRSDIIHIHGTSDLLFPIANISNVIAIENGTHIMNMVRIEEVNKALLDSLSIPATKNNDL